MAEHLRSDPAKPKNSEFIKRETEWKWTIDAPQGEIMLNSVGFKQYIRAGANI